MRAANVVQQLCYNFQVVSFIVSFIASFIAVVISALVAYCFGTHCMYGRAYTLSNTPRQRDGGVRVSKPATRGQTVVKWNAKNSRLNGAA